jgi:hypothetical protein
MFFKQIKHHLPRKIKTMTKTISQVSEDTRNQNTNDKKNVNIIYDTVSKKKKNGK